MIKLFFTIAVFTITAMSATSVSSQLLSTDTARPQCFSSVDRGVDLGNNLDAVELSSIHSIRAVDPRISSYMEAELRQQNKRLDRIEILIRYLIEYSRKEQMETIFGTHKPKEKSDMNKVILGQTQEMFFHHDSRHFLDLFLNPKSINMLKSYKIYTNLVKLCKEKYLLILEKRYINLKTFGHQKIASMPNLITGTINKAREKYPRMSRMCKFVRSPQTKQNCEKLIAGFCGSESRAIDKWYCIESSTKGGSSSKIARDWREYCMTVSDQSSRTTCYKLGVAYEIMSGP